MIVFSKEIMKSEGVFHNKKLKEFVLLCLKEEHREIHYFALQMVERTTKKEEENFIKMLKYRRNGNYDDIPHFCITKAGKIYKILEPEYSSTTFGNTSIDRKQIKIAVENLGWLNRNTITGIYNNWINDPFRGTPHIRG